MNNCHLYCWLEEINLFFQHYRLSKKLFLLINFSYLVPDLIFPSFNALVILFLPSWEAELCFSFPVFNLITCILLSLFCQIIKNMMFQKRQKGLYSPPPPRKAHKLGNNAEGKNFFSSILTVLHFLLRFIILHDTILFLLTFLNSLLSFLLILLSEVLLNYLL